MFKQVKSAVFWYYLYKFRKRVSLIFLLLIIALFANAIYADIVEYLKLKEQLQYLELALGVKWGIILFNLTFSVYLILTMFKKDEVPKEKTFKEKIFTSSKKDEKSQEKKEVINQMDKKKSEKFTQREKEFLYKKKLKNKADMLVEK